MGEGIVVVLVIGWIVDRTDCVVDGIIAILEMLKSVEEGC